MDNAENVAINEEDQEFRTCSASFLNLISYLSEDTKGAFIKTLGEKQTAATDYVIDFSEQVFKMITLLKTSTFVKKNGNEIEIQQRNDLMIKKSFE